jgi:ubiquinone/menaquinone biosynthesis C-methylase UbiE
MTDDRRIKGERAFWSRQAPKYDRWIKNTFDGQYNIFRTKFRSAMNSDDSVLEIGTGTGDITFNIASRCKNVIGTDISAEMISEAFEKLSRTNLTNVKFQVEDAYDLSFDKGSFDKVICCNALQLMHSPFRAIDEGRRVLKKGGEFISITYCYGDSGIIDLIKLLKFALKRGKPKYWKNLKRSQLIDYFEEDHFEILEQEDVWEHPVVLYLRCKKH